MTPPELPGTPENMAEIARGLTKAQPALLAALTPMLGGSDANAANYAGFTYAVRARGQGLVSCLALSRRELCSGVIASP